ncbi:MAG: GNAT superfamily N-acetyltransferase [Paracoccaceae bacterium]|jgi:GNAT superfamily N-acetyltransferase
MDQPDVTKPDVAGLVRADLSVADAPRGTLLSTEIGWNQTEADWSYMLANGPGIGLTDPDGKLVASALALPYGQFGWVCMVLVAPDWRRLGLATDLMNGVIELLQADGIVPGLDATPAGREVYRRIGFVDVYGLERFVAEQAELAAIPPTGIEIRVLTEADMDAVADFDGPVFAGDRATLLRHLQSREPSRAMGAWKGTELTGFALARDGRTWTQIGPVIAADEDTAKSLVAAAANSGSGPEALLIDAMDYHAGYLDWLKAGGFEFQRPYIRMLHGSDQPLDRKEMVFSPAGPELG